MKFTIKAPEAPKDQPIAVIVRDCGGYEGIQIEVIAQGVPFGHCEGLMAIDPHGNVWTGDCYDIKLGHFLESGVFIWEKP